MAEKQRKPFKMPHTLVIIFVIILFAVALTWVIPAGEYQRVKDEVTGTSLVDPNSFQYIENTPVNPLKIMDYVVKGFTSSISLILMILFAGSAFHMVTQSGALQASVAKVARNFSNRLYLFIPMLTLVFTLIATNQGVNLFIPFVPITMMLAFTLGLDSIVGVGIILIGGAVGFSTGTLQTSTTLVAQEIAGLQPFSGIGYRFLCLIVFYVVSNVYLIRYALRIQKTPTLSPTYEQDQSGEMKFQADLDSFGGMTWNRWAILAALVVCLGIIVYGGLKLDWGNAEFAVMFLCNVVINAFITSGSGQAAVVMPLFLPVADLVGMTRQTAILAFNFGDGFCNYILPTSTALMGMLGAANVPYDKWMKFMWKLFLIWCVLGCILVSIAQLIHLA